MTKPNFNTNTIWTGDNLEVMRGLNSNTVDLVYLDPPFNSNRNYSAPVGSKAAGAAFKDMWTLSDIDEHEHGELADRCPPAYDLIKSARTIAGKGMQSYLIFMAVRLLELQRVLKDTGSIYLHCDDTAGAYLKLLMDAVFGRTNGGGAGNTGADITWHRSTNKNTKQVNFARCTDLLLLYRNGDDYTHNPQYEELGKAHVARKYTYDDNDGRGKYMTAPMVAKHCKNKDTWQGVAPNNGGWIHKVETRERLLRDNLVRFSSTGGMPRYKKFLSESKGTPVSNIWTDVKAINSMARERTGYPTQKPLALLERIIKASSNEGDVVFDPFCGCATTLVAAHNLGRNWIGCDLSELAVKLVNQRILEFDPLFAKAINPDNNPRRTDTKKLPNYRTHAHKLYGDQEGICKGCDIHFPFGALTVDHKLPRSKGGQDHLDNLQLLCTRCNSSKGNKTMAEWNATRK